MLQNLLLIALSLGLLFAGAEFLVRGSASLALRFGLSSLMVGLTIVAFGTSSPELFVSLKASMAGQGDIVLGNVVGSNIFNIGIILGLTALVCPVPVHRRIIKLDAPVALGAALLVPLILLNNQVGRWEGMALFAGAIAYTWMNVILARREPTPTSSDPETEGLPPVSGHWIWDVALILAGLAILILGSRLLVDNAVSLARTLQISEAVIGLTIIAAGTSMPELATSVVAALRKQPDIVMGNVIGSNIFNVLAILGVTSLLQPIQSAGMSTLDLAAMIVFSTLLIPLIYTGRLLHQVEGALLLLLYGGYLYLLWPK